VLNLLSTGTTLPLQELFSAILLFIVPLTLLKFWMGLLVLSKHGKQEHSLL
jgi:hypothetical protein